MSDKLEKIIDQLDALSVGESAELVKILEDTWGVKANPWEGMDFQPPIEEKEDKRTEFDVELTSFGSKKIQIIKALRAITGLGLRDAKELTEKAPVVIKEGVSEVDAEELKRTLENEGAQVTIL